MGPRAMRDPLKRPRRLPSLALCPSCVGLGVGVEPITELSDTRRARAKKRAPT